MGESRRDVGEYGVRRLAFAPHKALRDWNGQQVKASSPYAFGGGKSGLLVPIALHARPGRFSELFIVLV